MAEKGEKKGGRGKTRSRPSRKSLKKKKRGGKARLVPHPAGKGKRGERGEEKSTTVMGKKNG